MTYRNIRNIRARHIQLVIRARLRAGGAEKVVIHRNGQVDCYGRMPGSIVTGWYYAGDQWSIMQDLHHEIAVAEGRT